nr:helix-turn-helix domain-containing protein [Streptomyces sp. SID11385]
MDTTVPDASSEGFDNFRRGWEEHVGDGFPLPNISRATIGDFRVRTRAAKVHDVAITDVHGVSAIRTDGRLGEVEDQVRMWVVRRGAWALGGGPERHEGTVSAGQFLLRHVGRPSHFETAPSTTARVVVLPATVLGPLLGNRTVTGSADSPEVRLLVAHTTMIHTVLADLGQDGAQAARGALVELAKAVASHGFDDEEPRLAPALAQAAKDLAERRLTDPDLSATTLAREFNVSVRTMQRAFAAGEESVTAYIRRRRLEEARRALGLSSGRPSVSELAAHWQFADSSHFIRAFKRRYGQTPTEYIRSARSETS